jgi:hypothetical protein
VICMVQVRDTAAEPLLNVALGGVHASACASGIPSGATVDIALIIQAVNNALNGCGVG